MFVTGTWKLHLLVAIVEYLKMMSQLFCFFSRSNASYRLKHRVNLQDIWLHGLEDNLSVVDPVGDVDLRVTIVLAWALTFCWVFFR